MNPMQVPEEIIHLLRMLAREQTRRMLEIGTANGGTLFLFCRTLPDNAWIMSVDLPRGAFGGGYPRWKVPVMRSFAKPGQQLHLLRANSHLKETVAEVAARLEGDSLDFLFIDGDHTYAGARVDFEAYSPLVRRGGLIAFHDVVPHPSGSGGEVHKFWREIRDDYVHHEFVANPGAGYGIGVLVVT
ncbi:MAG: class I SAM-dependent methyltransferase [Phycisphaerae bacterium]|nr:class I SAM-dependent methyltransferase [Phycisphaerae bacterium]